MMLVYFQAMMMPPGCDGGLVVKMLVWSQWNDSWGIERHSRNSRWLQFLFLKFFHFMPCLLLYPIINNYHAFLSFYSYTILSSFNKFCSVIYNMCSYLVLVLFSFILICSLSDKNPVELGCFPAVTNPKSSGLRSAYLCVVMVTNPDDSGCF